MYDVFYMFFLQNLWTFSSLIILYFYVYCKQLVPRKYETPVYITRTYKHYWENPPLTLIFVNFFQRKAGYSKAVVSQKTVKMLLKLYPAFLWKYETNNGFLDSAHRYGIYNVKKNNYFFKKKLTKSMSIFTVMFVSVRDVIDHVIPHPVSGDKHLVIAQKSSQNKSINQYISAKFYFYNEKVLATQVRHWFLQQFSIFRLVFFKFNFLCD